MHIAHGAVMIVAAVLLPAGAFVAARRKLESWFQTHLILQAAGTVLLLTGIVLSFVMVEAHFWTGGGKLVVHGVAGLVILAGMVGQVALGLCRPQTSSKLRGTWARVHKAFGHTLWIVVLVNCIIGATIWIDEGEYSAIAIISAVAAMSFVTMAFAVLSRSASQRDEQGVEIVSQTV